MSLMISLQMQQTMKDKILVVEIKPGEHPKTSYLGTSLDVLQNAVGGYIELLTLGDGCHILYNEEGKLRGLEPNRIYGDEVIVGVMYITRVDDEGFFVYIEIVETKLSVCGNEITDTPKSRSSKRRIPIGENLKNEFKKYHLRCCEIFLKQGKHVKPDDYVICRSDGTFYEPNSFTRAWSRFLEKNGIRHLKLFKWQSNGGRTLKFAILTLNQVCHLN